MKPSEKQIDFATAIAEELGIDLPEELDRDEYHMFINDNVDEFYEEQNKRRYSDGNVFRLNHSYGLGDYEYDAINKNPRTM